MTPPDDQDRLNQARGQRPDRLGVDQVEPQIQLPLPIELAVRVGEVRSVRIGSRKCEVAGGRRAVILAPRAVGRGRGALGHACERPRIADICPEVKSSSRRPSSVYK